MIEIPKNKLLSEEKRMHLNGMVTIHRRYCSELQQVMRLDSNYEYDFALYLDHEYAEGRIVGWLRNTIQLTFSKEIVGRNGKATKRYIPDFLVFEPDGTYTVVEVKGWMNERSSAKIAQFKKDYPWMRYQLVTREDMLALQAEYQDKLWGWAKLK